MDWLLYPLARLGVWLLQSLPLPAVARLGRRGGALVYWLDARHRGVALLNLTRCLGTEKTAAEIRDIARENFRRIGENFACAVKTASMTIDELGDALEVVGGEKIQTRNPTTPPPSRVFAIGHFGNFELYARLADRVPGYRLATTYRALRQPSLNRLLQSMRERSGCLFFERRTDAEALKNALHSGGIALGLLADQHAGRRGVWGPFFGLECSTTAAPAVFALRYRCPLFTAFCYRTSLAHWRVEIGDEIPTLENGRARSIEAITRDLNAAFETAIRRDPANWFWVHRRWKPRRRDARAFPSSSRETARLEDTRSP